MERSDVPPQYRRRRQRSSGFGCNCDCNYARSLQGICKIVSLIVLGLAWIIIGASPYWRPIFVIGGQTWPFHIVMLFSVVVWLATLAMYCLFISGYHLSLGHFNWPRIELIFNICAAIFVIFAASIEAANIWRWDMSRGNTYTAGGTGGMYSNYYQYGLRPGMSFTQTLNFGSYCGSRPQDCRDYFSLLAGNNTYYTNHIFGVILLFIAVISYLVSTFFAYRTYRVFQRDMYKPGELPKPTIWMRFAYRVDQATSYVKGKATKVLGRGEDEEGEADIESDEGGTIDKSFIPPKHSDEHDGGFEEVRSSRSEGVSSYARSHSSHHTSRSHGEHRSKSRSSHHKDRDGRSSRSSTDRYHKHDDGRSSRHSTGHRSRSSSRPKDSDIKTKNPEYEVPPPYDEEPAPLSQPQPAGVFPHLNSKKGSKKGKKDENPPVDLSPVASVMI